jgi:hypothetical protein
VRRRRPQAQASGGLGRHGVCRFPAIRAQQRVKNGEAEHEAGGSGATRRSKVRAARRARLWRGEGRGAVLPCRP